MDADRLFDLAEHLADRLCHDVASTGQAIASGLDLLREARGAAERVEALEFLAQAVAAQQAKFGYLRRALAGAAWPISAEELRRRAEALFAELRPTLDWKLQAETLQPSPARILLLLLQIAADALAAGGRASVSGDERSLIVRAEGPRVNLRDETRAGLAGEPLGEGLAGRWVPAAFAAALAERAGGRIRVETGEGSLALEFDAPPTP